MEERVNICPRESHPFLGVTRLSTSDTTVCVEIRLQLTLKHAMELVQLVEWNLDVDSQYSIVVGILFVVPLHV